MIDVRPFKDIHHAYSDDDFTPTWQEYLWSHVPTWTNIHARLHIYNPWGPRDSEKAFYHAIDSWLILGATAAHAQRVGWYAATNTVHGYRMMNAASRFGMLANPVVLGAAATVGGAAYIAYKVETDESWASRARRLGSGLDFSSLG
jgi:hypothetical protein